MQKNSGIKFISGNEETVKSMKNLPALPIFSDEVCGFLQAVSAILMKCAQSKNYPDVMTFAFWCRKSSLQRMAEDYPEKNFRRGRGIVFHITPSNVAVNFAYSTAASLLAGNSSIVRLPSKDFPQVKIICSAFKKAFDEVPEMKNYLCFVNYGHEKNINDYFSGICDVRIIWGGDKTIAEIRQSPLKPRAGEITFADRYSIVVINADEYLCAEKKDRIASDFYNDTYLTDQNACTSPRLVVWLGENTKDARKIFWNELRTVIERENYNPQPVQITEKFTKLCLLGANTETYRQKSNDNIILCAEVKTLSKDAANYFGNSGFFPEYVAKNLEDILPICGERCQTLSFFGMERKILTDFVLKHRPRGIDRIARIGQTQDFSLIWDGHDLIREMSGKI